jgi:23S rRNA (uridine2552-2'-O)-methyltransferase
MKPWGSARGARRLPVPGTRARSAGLPAEAVRGPPAGKVRLRPDKKRRPSSHRWLSRQLNDPYVQQARQQGYRSRAAYKLLEIDRRIRLLTPGLRVLDLGSAPGGWAQVARARGCRVVGVDLLEMAPIPGALLLRGDVFDPATIARVQEALGGPADLVLSDLAAAATGRRTVDRLRAEALAERVLALLPGLLAAGGNALIKLLRGADAAVAAEARRQFAKVRLIRPEATRRQSTEIYLLGLGHRPESAGSGTSGPETEPGAAAA